MNTVEEIFESGKAEELSIDPFDVEEWAANKKAEREQAYSLIAAMAKSVATHGDKLKSYLDVQSRFNKYSVGNALLITSQMPNATRLADYKTWKDAGVHVKKGETGIVVLEPGKEYTRADGSTGVSYNSKRVFDISQTDSEKHPGSVEKYDMRFLIKMLINDAPCRLLIDGQDKVPEDKRAFYDSETKTIFARSDEDPDLIFKDIARELALAHLDREKQDVLDRDLIADCTAYMLCKRFNLSLEWFDYDPLPENFRTADDKEVRKQLGIMRDTANTILSDMQRGMEKQKEAAERDER
ncbi:MAG: hypothetical protein IJM61_01990 [Firmicutes bacterium]|nr:hypothetical protein [Bacillota bacterium]